MAKGQQEKHEQISEICEERFNNILNVDRNEYIIKLWKRNYTKFLM